MENYSDTLTKLRYIACKFVEINLERFTSILRQSYKSEKLLRESVIREFGTIQGIRLFDLSEDINSNPFCHIWKNSEFESLGLVEVYDFMVLKNNEISCNFHSAFSISIMIIDPLFGQFYDLDEAVEAHPELFIGRILVCTFDQLREAFGIEYVFKN